MRGSWTRTAPTTCFRFRAPRSPTRAASTTEGEVVGVYRTGVNHGFVLAPNDFSNFVTIDFPGAVATRALGINSCGDIVGTYGSTLGDGTRFPAGAGRRRMRRRLSEAGRWPAAVQCRRRRHEQLERELNMKSIRQYVCRTLAVSGWAVFTYGFCTASPIDQLFSNADGTLQYIQLVDIAPGQLRAGCRSSPRAQAAHRRLCFPQGPR